MLSRREPIELSRVIQSGVECRSIRIRVERVRSCQVDPEMIFSLRGESGIEVFSDDDEGPHLLLGNSPVRFRLRYPDWQGVRYHNVKLLRGDVLDDGEMRLSPGIALLLRRQALRN